MSLNFDVVVIGAGSSGYIAAVRAAQLGFRVACVEKWRNPNGDYALGGTCLNVGCIPSKALLASSEEFEKASGHLAEHGISASGVKIDVPRMIARKDAIVSKMTKGIEFLFRKNKIAWLKGHARFVSNEGESIRLEITEDGEEVQLVEAANVIIATGSRPRHLPGIPVDNKIVCDNEGALSLDMLREYALEYYHQVHAFPTYVSATHANCDDMEIRQMLLENLYEEENGPNNHPELWIRFAEALGVTRDQIKQRKYLSHTRA